jgi:hypothetical protein
MPGGLPCTSGGNVPLPLHGSQGRSFWSTPIPQQVEHRRRPDLGIGVLHILSTRRFESAPNRACTCAEPGKIVPDRVITVPTTRSLCPTQVPPCATTKPSSFFGHPRRRRIYLELGRRVHLNHSVPVCVRQAQRCILLSHREL